jgi:hypothetical protein
VFGGLAGGVGALVGGTFCGPTSGSIGGGPTSGSVGGGPIDGAASACTGESASAPQQRDNSAALRTLRTITDRLYDA